MGVSINSRIIVKNTGAARAQQFGLGESVGEGGRPVCRLFRRTLNDFASGHCLLLCVLPGEVSWISCGGGEAFGFEKTTRHFRAGFAGGDDCHSWFHRLETGECHATPICFALLLLFLALPCFWLCFALLRFASLWFCFFPALRCFELFCFPVRAWFDREPYISSDHHRRHSVRTLATYLSG